MRSPSRLFSILVLFAPVIAAACGGDDGATSNRSGAAAGAGRQRQAEAGQRGDAAGKGGAGGSAGLNVGRTDPCVPAPGNMNGVLEPLGDYCNQSYCPASIVDAAEKTLHYCSNTFPPRISFGCGAVTVDFDDFSGGVSYTFDSATNQVVGIRNSSDVGFGECNANSYLYGDAGFGDCPDTVTCYPCEDLRNDVKGAAGAAGAVGDIGTAGDTGSAGAGGAGGAGFVPPPPHCPKFSDL